MNGTDTGSGQLARRAEHAVERTDQLAPPSASAVNAGITVRRRHVDWEYINHDALMVCGRGLKAASSRHDSTPLSVPVMCI